MTTTSLTTTSLTPMASTPTTIDDVCDDVLMTIFAQYLDLTSVLRVQQVCHRFHDLIANLFDMKRALVLTDDDVRISRYSIEDTVHYSWLSVRRLCRLRDGLWMRTPRGLTLLTPLHIQMYSLLKYRHLTSLCLVITSRNTNEPLLDLIVTHCESRLQKLIVINTNAHKFCIDLPQMNRFCDKFSDSLTHFEVFSDYLYTDEDCFRQLVLRCTHLQVFKLNVKQVFKENVQSLGSNGQLHSYDSIQFSGDYLSETGHHLSHIDVSNPILNNDAMRRLSAQTCLQNVRHLGVQRVMGTTMFTICSHLQALQTLSFSMDNDMSSRDTASLIESVGQLKDLKKLSIVWFGHHSSNSANEPEVCETTLKGLKGCVNLKSLVVEEAMITQKSIEGIAQCVPLVSTLEVVNCTLNSLTFKSMNGCSQLKRLIVSKWMDGYDVREVFAIDPNNSQQWQELTTRCVDVGVIVPKAATYQLNAHNHMEDDDDNGLNGWLAHFGHIPHDYNAFHEFVFDFDQEMYY